MLSKETREKVFSHILENANTKEIFIDCIGGYLEHVHCLISLRNDQMISKVMQLIKGESSFWINRNKLTKKSFEWQDDYFAVSVSESAIDSVRNYIKNQKEHHKKKTFQDEYNEFIKSYKF